MTSTDATGDLSERIVAYLDSLTDEPLTTFRGLLEVASRLGCSIRMGEDLITSYQPDEDTDDEHAGGIIAIHVGDDPEEIGRGLLHETTHHIFAWWSFWHIPYPEWYAHRLGDPEFEERVCCAVVQRILPLPVQFQLNGKIAIPDTGPVFRHFPVKFICPGFMSMSTSDLEDQDEEDEARL